MELPTDGVGWIVAALTAGAAWAKARWDAKASVAAAEQETERKRLDVDSSQEITITERLFAEIDALRDHNAEQDKAHVALLAQVGDLKAELAKRDAMIDERDRQIVDLIEKLDRVKGERNEAVDSLRRHGLFDPTDPL